VTFQCNICGQANHSGQEDAAGFGRDEASCGQCGSTVRLRALMRTLSVEIFGIPLPLDDFPVMKSVRGLGLADDLECSRRLAAKFDYRNTFYHAAPRLDIAQPADGPARYDFVLAGDIFEHVAPPVERAFANLRALLEPHGFLAMTVPYSPAGGTREHFPELRDFGLVTVAGRTALVNRTAAGEWQIFDDLVFHGGHGSTLELRIFGEPALRDMLAAAGFPRVDVTTEGDPRFGIVHREAWSLPIVAGGEPFRWTRAGMAEVMEQHAWLQGHAARLDAERLRLAAEFEDRTRWAFELEAEVKRRTAETARLAGEADLLRRRLGAFDASRWTLLGRALGRGPKLPEV
jgi:hypothetical protein